MAVAFAVIFMAHIEKQLLAASPQKPILWKIFIDDIFSVWTLPEKEISNFVEKKVGKDLKSSSLEESLEQVSDERFYKPLVEPIVSQTAAKVKINVNTLFANGHIDKMTYKWLNREYQNSTR